MTRFVCHSVYGLVDERAPSHIRYIGVTSQRVAKRANDHEGEVRLRLKRGTHLTPVQRWVASVMNKGHHIRAVEVFVGSRDECWMVKNQLGGARDLLNSNYQTPVGKPPGRMDTAEARAKKAAAWAADLLNRRKVFRERRSDWVKRNPETVRRLTARLHTSDARRKAGQGRARAWAALRASQGYPFPELSVRAAGNREHWKKLLASPDGPPRYFGGGKRR